MKALPLLLALALPLPLCAQPTLPRLEAPKRLDARKPIAIVVHGIHPEAGQLDPLAADLTARGYETYQFHYDSKQDLDRSATQLGLSVRSLIAQRGKRPARLLVVAHSMGGLVARKALTRDAPSKLARWGGPTRLVTVASPFGGFRSANFAKLDFGLGPGSYDDLGSWSKFIRKPGALGPGVTHVKVETDEADATQVHGGKSVSDEVVSLKRQRQKRIDAGASKRLVIKAGHVGAVNQAGQVSRGFRAVLDRAVGLRPGTKPIPLEVVAPPATPTKAPERRRRGMSKALGRKR